eukprot:7382840-Prymnesium_polylepis.1
MGRRPCALDTGAAYSTSSCPCLNLQIPNACTHAFGRVRTDRRVVAARRPSPHYCTVWTSVNPWCGGRVPGALGWRGESGDGGSVLYAGHADSDLGPALGLGGGLVLAISRVSKITRAPLAIDVCDA